MKICVAQTNPVKADIRQNINNHLAWTERALEHGTGMILFPELSLTGYEPGLAQDLAMDPDDPCLDVFQQVSDLHQVTLGLGMPLKGAHGTYISQIFFQAHSPRQVYRKQYLHQDEEPYFIPGKGQLFLSTGNLRIAPAICYEISIPEHAARIMQNGASVYMASVAKTRQGVDQAVKRLPEIALQYSIPVMMSNCIGICDQFLAGGRSSVWNKEGLMVGQLPEAREGLLIYDTATGEVSERLAG